MVTSMFDCPEHSHTSPMRMFCIFSPAMVMVYGPPAFILGRFMRHLPRLSAVTRYILLSNSTIKLSPAAAVPHTGMGVPLCKTMPS